ncbi:iron-containing redox enzyme family protein [Rhodococcus maanshanensis]|uniref:iron-containing redox enzyme family protein n=1 Tax=Rhodococcus maanshanensis TaxID=183556 RepID=UPI0022B4D60C|nr:iron-containing redox enzyme family protein [Rhodococcus maanshanensis]MCZ4554046.1 iron-containing redox enzyme family protein [Rhodococcus maanshanensis]
MPLPPSRGPLSAKLLDVFMGLPAVADFREEAQRVAVNTEPAEVLRSEDIQLTLTLLYELHLQGLSGVSDDWEWDLDLLAARTALEQPFERGLRDIVTPPTCSRGDVEATLWELAAADNGPALSKYMAHEATLEQFRELLAHRSLYQLREADVHTLGIPRLSGAPKAALVEVQEDEYGGGRPERMHSALFAQTLRVVGMDDGYAQYLTVVPALTLASLNALSLFGLHRRCLGELVGHLCAVETTSSGPSKLYSSGLRRLGFGRAATLFFDEHVEADSVHEQIAVRDLAGGLIRQHPDRAEGVLFGAAASLALDALVADHMMSCWAAGRSSLRSTGGLVE